MRESVTASLLLLGAAAAPALAQRPAPPAPPPAEWLGLIGEYGSGAMVLERDGRLVLRLDSLRERVLERRGRDRYRGADAAGDSATVRFARGSSGRAAGMLIGDSVLLRRALGAEDGAVFRITPMRPVEVLRAEAARATPPVETGSFRPSELVELVTLDSTIKLDIRYASTRNFLGAAFYRSARAFLQRPAAEAAVRAHRRLREAGYGLLIHDGYRPWSVTWMFWEATPQAQRGFVADPSRGSRHNRGAAVDLTLYELGSGMPVEMPGGYDEFSRRSFPDYPGGTSRQRWLRDLLRQAMEAEGFTVFESEWWHFDWKDWREYRIGNLEQR
ncbi:MAG: M15 family metallopeptidase [Gemmatimonadales bacterium]